jgi:hypothetical protein
MKKIYLILAVAFMAIFSYNAQAQPGCEDCVSPRWCATRVIQLGDCGSVTVVVCVECMVAYAEANIEIISVETNDGWDPDCDINDDYYWDEITEYLNIHSLEFCGLSPCGMPKTVYVSHFVCMRAYKDNDGNVTIVKDVTGCGDRREVCKYFVCYDYENQIPVVSLDLNYTFGEGDTDESCTKINTVTMLNNTNACTITFTGCPEIPNP